MPINTNGNKASKFGKYLPTVYLDEIQVFSEEITVHASCYFIKPETINETEDTVLIDWINNTLSDLNLTFILLPDGMTKDLSIIGTTTTGFDSESESVASLPEKKEFI